jgi:LPXTG-site transpeptidase (sortase) family protein
VTRPEWARRAVAACGAALLVASLTYWVAGRATDHRGPAGQVSALPAAALTEVPSSTRSPRPVSARDAQVPAGPTGSAAPPTRLLIPRLKVQMPVVATGLDPRGFMDLPDSSRVAGWYRHGPAPGRGTGATVLAAHVDTKREGAGPLARMVKLKQGDRIDVVAGQRTHSYRVVSLARLNKRQVDLDRLFARSGAERLHLITCGGPFDAEAGRYEDNVVAIASRVGPG